MKMPRQFLPLAAIAFLLLALVSAGGASAHLLGLPFAAHGEFAAGFLHPLSGLDHILAMGAVGMLAAHKGGRALWTLPAVFVSAMIAGFAAARLGIAAPWVEAGIAVSLVALGLAIAGGNRISFAACAALIALCALLHGHAHGTEALALADPLRYVAGFALATAILHAFGIAFGIGLRRLRMLPAAGYAVAAIGLVFVLQS
jgi:urease accessory protein